MKRKTNRKYISNLAKDLILMKLTPQTTLAQARSKFYRLMRKHKIAEGTKDGNGRRCDNFEWTMAKTLFISRIESYFTIDMMFLGPTPKDLLSY